MLTYLTLGMVAGIAASPHCAGMCGAFPLHLSRSAGRGRPVGRHIFYVGGKIFTYAFLGALAGAFGQWVVRSDLFSRSQHLLAYLLGTALAVYGLAMMGAFASIRVPMRGLQDWSPVQQLCTGLFRAPGVGAAFLLGVATGFLPCPITLAMCAAAAATGSAALGMLVMVGLGIGTSGVLLAIGASGVLLDTRVRRIGLRGAGAIMLVIGITTLLRPSNALCRVLPSIGPSATHCEPQD